jgi:tetratricopeptide (TPR) repeat protein
MFTVPSLSGIRMVLLGAALTAAAPSAFTEPPRTRAEALESLRHAETARRAEAVVWLANHGGIGDAPLLHERLRDESPFVRSYAERALWVVWSRSGDAAIDELLARGVDEMQAGDHKAALSTFSEVVKRKPEFAEGWNKRATVYFLAGDYPKSIADCDQVLKRNPGHFGALSGLGMIYSKLEDYDKALAWFRRALEVNPNLLGAEFEMRRIELLLREKRGKTI